MTILKETMRSKIKRKELYARIQTLHICAMTPAIRKT